MQRLRRIPWARPILKQLDATYRLRAVPPGTVRYWSWLFAAAESRAPLLGIYALGAEWQALLDPSTELSVAHLKLAWWQDEMQRLTAGAPVHPISNYLAALPRAGCVDFTPLLAAVSRAALFVGGVPLERGAELEPLCREIWGDPLALVSRLSADGVDEASVRNCTTSLALAGYLAKSIRGYRREARAGRVPFAIDELLAAGVDNADLAADPPPAHLQSYLDRLHDMAAQGFAAAAQALPRAERSRHRHLLVLAALGQGQLSSPAPALERRRLKDMLLAWKIARRAH
jgi:15-cis-phytoene synthase